MKIERKFNPDGASFERLLKSYVKETADDFIKYRVSKQQRKGDKVHDI